MSVMVPCRQSPSVCAMEVSAVSWPFCDPLILAWSQGIGFWKVLVAKLFAR